MKLKPGLHRSRQPASKQKAQSPRDFAVISGAALLFCWRLCVSYMACLSGEMHSAADAGPDWRRGIETHFSESVAPLGQLQRSRLMALDCLSNREHFMVLATHGSLSYYCIGWKIGGFLRVLATGGPTCLWYDCVFPLRSLDCCMPDERTGGRLVLPWGFYLLCGTPPLYLR